MSTKKGWQSIHDALIEVDGQAAEPPTAEEMIAYRRGELSAEDEARVRALLVRYPDLARAVATEFPADDARPGDPDYLSEEDLDARWASMEKRIGTGRVLQFHPAWLAVAAALALVFAGLYWQAESNMRQLRHELSLPRIASQEQLLLPDGSRGPSDGTTLAVEGDPLRLVVTLISAARYPRYRLEIVDANGTTLWSRADLQPSDNDTFTIDVPRAFLKPGTYQVILHGIDGAREERVASYTMRVPRT